MTFAIAYFVIILSFSFLVVKKLQFCWYIVHCLWCLHFDARFELLCYNCWPT